MIHRSLRHSFLMILVVFASWSVASGQQTASLPDEQVKERLSFLEKALDSAQPRAKTWWYGWIAGYTAGALGQGALAGAHWNDVKQDESIPDGPPVRDRDFAEDMLVGGVTCALGAGGLLIKPFLPAYGPNELRSMPEGTPEERQTKLLQAEELLRRCAQREKEGRGWLTHLLNLGVNVAAGVVTVAAFDRPWHDGLITFAINESVSLLNIFTQPRRAIRDWQNYEVRYLGGEGAYVERPAESEWVFSVRPGGFSVGIRF